jgi:adenosylmethionine-8-amino-7-oxononanoate aminotransferase
VGGATLGAIVPPEGYWQRIREICDQFDLFLIADEVMTGFGRTGKWFATEHWEVTPDMMTMAKGTAGGYFPLSITAVHGELVEDIVQGSGDFVHGGTYSHHPVAAAAGLATLRFLQEKNLISSVASTGARLGEKLRSSFANGSCVGDIRGIGLLWALEFVADRDQKTPFPPSYHFAQTIADEAFRRGLIIYPSTGCVDGLAGDLIMLGPPYSITESQVDEILEVLHEAIQAAQETWTH